MDSCVIPSACGDSCWNKETASLSPNFNLGKAALISLSTRHYRDSGATGGWGHPTDILEKPGLEQRRNSGQRRFFLSGKAPASHLVERLLFRPPAQALFILREFAADSVRQIPCGQLCLLTLSTEGPGHPGHPVHSVSRSACGNKLPHSAAIKGPRSFLLDTWVRPPDVQVDVTWGPSLRQKMGKGKTRKSPK